MAIDSFIPPSVTIAGSLQDELGCPGDWQPDCAATHLVYDAVDDVWQGTFSLPVGSYEYKAAIDDSWDENYGANAQFNGANIAFDLAIPTDVKFYFDETTKWVTDSVTSTIATAAGSFQSELGCPGDWQPDCLVSWMQDIDGDGVYTFATNQIPAGSHEFKVALDEGWTESYPGGNVAFTATDGATITFTYDSSTNDVSVDEGAGTAEPGDELLVRPPVREAAQDDVFYFVMPDRFDNGDTSNDTGGDASGDRLVNGFDPTDKGFYHGGDLAGLTARLPYLDGLGVTAVWMTPQFTNKWVQDDGTPGGISAGYHGYWQTDYSSIDPHFGTNAEMQALVAAAHALGIDIYFDIVANHTGDVITYTEGDNPPYVSKSDAPYLDATGAPFDDRDFAGTGTFPALDSAVSFPYTPTFRTAADESAKSPRLPQRPAQLPQPRQQYVHRREQPLRRLLRARRPVHREARGARRVDPGLRGHDHRLRHRWVPDRHGEARQRRVLAGLRTGDRQPRRLARQDRLLRVRRGVRQQPGGHLPVHDRAPPRRRARLRFPGQRTRLRLAERRHRRPPRLLRLRRPVHRRRQQRLVAYRPSSATTTWGGSAGSSPRTIRAPPTPNCWRAISSPMP